MRIVYTMAWESALSAIVDLLGAGKRCTEQRLRENAST